MYPPNIAPDNIDKITGPGIANDYKLFIKKTKCTNMKRKIAYKNNCSSYI